MFPQFLLMPLAPLMQYCGTKPAMTISLTQRHKLVVSVLKEALCAPLGKFSHF
jgi:hypothetical protein